MTAVGSSSSAKAAVAIGKNINVETYEMPWYVPVHYSLHRREEAILPSRAA
jgi:hypothetical protein